MAVQSAENNEKRYDQKKKKWGHGQGDSLAWDGLGKTEVTSALDPHQLTDVSQASKCGEGIVGKGKGVCKGSETKE